MFKIIGITGTNGAGKGTIVEYLCSKYNFYHYSVRNFLMNIISEKGMPINRNSMIEVANELRSSFGPSYIIDELSKLAELHNKNCVIESIRTLGEVISIRSKGNSILIAIDADSKTRFDRISFRKSETDFVTFEKFIKDENNEMSSSDPNKQNISSCMKDADFFLDNNGSFQSLYSQIDDIMRNILI